MVGSEGHLIKPSASSHCAMRWTRSSDHRSQRDPAWSASPPAPSRLPGGRAAQHNVEPMRTSALVLLGVLCLQAPSLRAQIKAQLPNGPMTPAWDKGIQPISRDSYWNAIECGKQGGARPPCVFYDTDLCKNDDFTLALYTPYKAVAYEVWRTVRNHQPAPTPSYSEAQRTRITLGVTPAAGSRNAITGVVIKRGSKTIEPAAQALDATGGKFTFDFAAFAPTGDITIELVGRLRTHTCSVQQPVLTMFR
jgi:hypothetical protein